ncbi:hypothetical protein GCM10010121_020090 [Streptomyces brasiliensis]|uniref:Fibrillarin n=1 Tax=Streptomyces brasiliensis TaxID=1954 RepID=A0A917KD09_9ACTN|nr:hypothetical protein GCM10010121_020090 [Streptomyces brasiliensis]
MRAAHTVLGSVIGVVWLMFPWMTISGQDPVPAARAGPVAEAAAPPERDETSPVDLILPLAVAAAAGVLATYAYVRRTRRARTRTTPGVVSAHPPVPTPAGLERQARTALVVADDSVRTSEEELAFAQARFGAEEVEPFTHALAAARTELSAAFAIRRRYEQGVPADDAARRQALVGIVGRCAEAGRRLDAEAEAFDQLRAPERGVGAALEIAEGRFRELAGRTGAAEATLAGLRARYASSATAPVLGHSEQAKDRLVFATAELNRARRTADSGAVAQAARPLRAAEGAIAQAGVFVRGVERLSAELAEAAKLVPAALTGAEAELATARGWGAPDASVPVGELHARIRHADVVLAAVRHELTGAPYDPLDALRRIARAVEPLGVGRAGVVPVAARLVARSAVGGAADFVSTHRGAVGAEARTLLAEAERLLAARNEFAAADGLARQARESAEQDVRVHGNPYDATGEQAGGAAGALLGGILLGEEADGGPPASFGGPGTRGRRRLPRG